ncbi:PH domain-containing protein [Aeoliella mucimassa]|uniref:Bacterial membrane flanked domain protein n=1 Tax=Aeoliella mucimassa TaxID=2527972 RepID=A0A518AUK2_9BACT|nr:PH domain-containing protein [Aeoliella mucimassa]QDU58403.1 Bacterial membrane flanked domain protein [Aeoliella mucimassa]
MNQNQPIREVQPVVIPAQYFVFGPLASAFFALFPGFFTFIISNMIARSFDPVIQYGLIVYVLSFLGFMWLMYLKCFIEPQKTVYRIYENKLEYSEGFLNRQQRTVVFDQVVDVQLNEGLLQQTRGAGSITLTTQQLISTGEGKLTNRSVVLSNIPNPQEIYDLLRDLAIGE